MPDAVAPIEIELDETDTRTKRATAWQMVTDAWDSVTGMIAPKPEDIKVGHVARTNLIAYDMGHLKLDAAFDEEVIRANVVLAAFVVAAQQAVNGEANFLSDWARELELARELDLQERSRETAHATATYEQYIGFGGSIASMALGAGAESWPKYGGTICTWVGDNAPAIANLVSGLPGADKINPADPEVARWLAKQIKTYKGHVPALFQQLSQARKTTGDADSGTMAHMAQIQGKMADRHSGAEQRRHQAQEQEFQSLQEALRSGHEAARAAAQNIR